MSAIGTAFLFASFVFTYTDFIAYTPFGENLSRYNIIWALTGSVLGTYIGSALVGRGRVGFKEALVGTITGGIIMGDAAPALHNIGLTIMIGAIGGFFSGLYMRLIHPRVNRTNILDAMGLFGPFLITSLLGSLVVTPAIIIWYSNQGVVNQGIGTTYRYTLAGWQLVYVGISAALGIGCGLFAGILSVCDKNYFALASNSRMF